MKIARARKTVCEMLIDRGFTINENLSECTVDDLRNRFEIGSSLLFYRQGLNF